MNTYGGDFYKRKPSATGIGYGKRSDFTRCLTVSPSSSKYHLKSFWDENNSKRKGAVIGLSRDVFQLLSSEFPSINTYPKSSRLFLLQRTTQMINQKGLILLNILSDPKRPLSIKGTRFSLKTKILDLESTLILKWTRIIPLNMSQSSKI